MELIILSMVFISSTLMFMIIGGLATRKKILVRKRLTGIEDMGYLGENGDDELRKPFAERVIDPLYRSLTETLAMITPKELKRKYEFLIIQAGKGSRSTPSSIITLQFMLGVFIGVLFYLFTRISEAGPNYILITTGAIIGVYLPYSMLNTEARKRKVRIQKSLPDFLDLLYVSVESGLGFDSALRKTSSKMAGPLSEEIHKAMDDIIKGKDRHDAFKGAHKRTGVDDVNAFITAVIQSESLGTNITSMLKVQSMVMRQKRRQRAEEAAMKIPVKMLIPIVFLMFPALFVVIMGPAVMQIIDTLGGGLF